VGKEKLSLNLLSLSSKNFTITYRLDFWNSSCQSLLLLSPLVADCIPLSCHLDV
jgi:hypothetical protein